MPVTLVTGLPGAGKTQWLLWHIEKTVNAGSEKRPVYQFGVHGLKLPWFKIEKPSDIPLLETGALIVVDECQHVWPPMATSAARPAHYTKYLTEHRHQGHDLFILTQDPSLIDSHVRKLVDTHYHLVRPFGFQFANVHRFAGLNENPGRSRRGSVVSKFNYKPEVYQWYESSEKHTIKRNVPLRFYLLFILPVLALLLYGYASSWVFKRALPGEKPAASDSAAPAFPGYTGARPVPAQRTLEDFIPRVEGLSYTAPVYDQAQPIVTAPKPAACISSASRCQCWTDQATRLDVPDALCRQIARDGWFDPSRVVPASMPAPTPAIGPA